MSNPYGPQPGQPDYIPPQPPPGYPATPPPPGYPAAPPYTGYSVPGYQAVPVGGPGYRAPGSVTTAAVLAYIESGLLFLVGILLLAFSSALGSLLPDFGAAVAIIALIPIAVGVLFILAARQLQTGKNKLFLLVMGIIASAL